MKKPNPVEVIGAVVTVAVTAKVAADLADHSVGALIVLSVVLSMLSAGLTLTDKIAKAAATEMVRCSTAGCSFAFRVRRSHSPERVAVLRELVADHGRHGSAGA